MKLTGRRSKNIIDMRSKGAVQSSVARKKADVLVDLSLMRGRAYEATGDMKHMRRAIDLANRAQSIYDLSRDYENGKGGPSTRRRKRS